MRCREGMAEAPRGQCAHEFVAEGDGADDVPARPTHPAAPSKLAAVVTRSRLAVAHGQQRVPAAEQALHAQRVARRGCRDDRREAVDRTAVLPRGKRGVRIPQHRLQARMTALSLPPSMPYRQRATALEDQLFEGLRLVRPPERTVARACRKAVQGSQINAVWLHT